MGQESTFAPNLMTVDADIANGASLTAAINLFGTSMVAIAMSDAWTAAALTFQGSYDGTIFFDLFEDAGAEVAGQAAASRYIRLGPALWAGVQHIKVRSGTPRTPVNQGAARKMKLMTRSI